MKAPEVKKLIDESLQTHCELDDQKREELKNILIESIGELKKDIAAMAPTVKEIKDIGTFFRVGRQVGFSVVFIATVAGAVTGIIYAIKNWINEP